MPKGTGQQLPSTPNATAPVLDSTLFVRRLFGARLFGARPRLHPVWRRLFGACLVGTQALRISCWTRASDS